MKLYRVGDFISWNAARKTLGTIVSVSSILCRSLIEESAQLFILQGQRCLSEHWLLKSSQGCKIRTVNQSSPPPCHRWRQWWRCTNMMRSQHTDWTSVPVTNSALVWHKCRRYNSHSCIPEIFFFSFFFFSQITKADFPELLEQHRRPL